MPPVWERQHVFDLIARNPEGGRRNNYSLASNQATERTAALQRPHRHPSAGAGLSARRRFGLYVQPQARRYGHRHRPVRRFPSSKPTQHEMVYIGGGAGMAPLRAHLSHLFETGKTARRVSFWYGARSKQEIYYQEYFTELGEGSPELLVPSRALVAPA